jgi:hypothetical protein
MIGPGKTSTEVDYNVVVYLLVANPLAILSCCESYSMCIKSITIMQKLNSPFLQSDRACYQIRERIGLFLKINKNSNGVFPE